MYGLLPGGTKPLPEPMLPIVWPDVIQSCVPSDSADVGCNALATSCDRKGRGGVILNSDIKPSGQICLIKNNTWPSVYINNNMFCFNPSAFLFEG